MNEKDEKSILTIKKKIRDSERREITGALVGEIIKRTTPDLNVRELVELPSGPGAVSRFIEKFLNDTLAKSGRQGSDLVYTIINEADTPAYLDDPLSAISVWREFVRPKSHNHIILDITTDEKAPRIYVSKDIPINGTAIDNATYEELEKIRAEFTDIINNDSIPSDQEKLISTEPYTDWSAALKKHGKNLYRQWVEFRIEKIVKIFDERLASLDVDPSNRNRLCELLKQSQRGTNAKFISNRTNHPASNTHTPTISTQDLSIKGDSELLDIVVRAVRSLSETEIRELRLPVGAFWDAIKNK